MPTNISSAASILSPKSIPLVIHRRSPRHSQNISLALKLLLGPNLPTVCLTDKRYHPPLNMISPQPCQSLLLASFALQTLPLQTSLPRCLPRRQASSVQATLEQAVMKLMQIATIKTRRLRLSSVSDYSFFSNNLICDLQFLYRGPRKNYRRSS
jgi:hypothetical protein